MTETAATFDFNDAGAQKSFDVIPDNTVCVLQMAVQPGQAGDGGWLTRAKDGASEHLNCEFTVVGGDHDRRKLWTRLTVAGTNHTEAIDISRKTLAAMLESARGIRPDDKSDAARAARQVHGWGEFDQLRFVARLGVEPPKNGYAAKNMIKAVITPDKQEWHKPEQLASKPTSAASSPAPAPANAIARPAWAQDAVGK